jgi:CheY-like chemotaxis protein
MHPMTRACDTDQKAPLLNGQRILVVEDHTHTAALVRQALLSAGATEVAVAADGREALEQLPVFRPDVIVTDMHMPRVGGLDLVRTVRQAAIEPNVSVPNPSVPIVLVSAFGGTCSVRSARAVGIDAFVVKPFSLGSLLKRVDRAGRRTAAFIVDPAYIGPDRRSRPRSCDDAQTEWVREAAPSAHPPALRLVSDADQPGEPAPTSMLQMFYERIQALEQERLGEPS